MRRSNLVALALALAVVPPKCVTAQDTLPVKVGERVRITTALNKHTGVLSAMNADTLAMDGWRVALGSVTRLEVSRRRKSNVRRGALIGFLAGAGVGVIAGFAGGDDPPGFISFTAEEKAALGAFGLGAGGGLVGLIAGALIKTDQWEELSLDRLRVSFAPQLDGRFALGLSVIF